MARSLPDRAELLNALRKREAIAALLVTAIALAPVVTVVITRWGRRYFPVLDTAVMDMRVRDVWSRDIPLVGPFSRFGWSHPGPLMYYLIAPLSLVTGQAAWATLIGSALLQAVAIVWTARLAWVRGRLHCLVAWLGVMSLAYLGAHNDVGAGILLTAWNPHVAFPFFVLLLLQLWILASGDSRHLVGTVFVASLLVQTHVGYAPFVGAGALWAGYCWHRNRSEAAQGSWRSAALVGVSLWTPVLVDCAVHFPGNLWRIARTFATGSKTDRPIGFRVAAALLAREFRWLPPWLGGHELRNLLGLALPTSSWLLVVPVAILAAAALIARRRDDRDGLRLVGLLALSLAIGVVALSRVLGEPFPYLFYWRNELGASVVVFSFWTVLRNRPGRAGELPFAALSILLVVATGWSSTVLAGSVARAPRFLDGQEPVVAAFVRELNRRGQPAQPVIIRPAGGFGGLADGVLDELDREGKPVHVDAGTLYAYGYHRVSKPAKVAALWYVVEDSAMFSTLSAAQGADVLVRTYPLAPGDEAELSRLQLAVIEQLDQTGQSDLVGSLNTSLASVLLHGVAGIDHDAVARISQLNRLVERSGTCRCGIVSFPPDEPPS